MVKTIPYLIIAVTFWREYYTDKLLRGDKNYSRTTKLRAGGPDTIAF
jgi:hypothetical protein